MLPSCQHPHTSSSDHLLTNTFPFLPTANPSRKYGQVLFGLKTQSGLDLPVFFSFCVDLMTNGGPRDLKVLYKSEELQKHKGCWEMAHCVTRETEN